MFATVNPDDDVAANPADQQLVRSASLKIVSQMFARASAPARAVAASYAPTGVCAGEPAGSVPCSGSRGASDASAAARRDDVGKRGVVEAIGLRDAGSPVHDRADGNAGVGGSDVLVRRFVRETHERGVGRGDEHLGLVRSRKLERAPGDALALGGAKQQVIHRSPPRR